MVHASINAMQQYYSTVGVLTYLGWSEDLEGVRICQPNIVTSIIQKLVAKVAPKPAPRLATITAATCNVRAAATTASAVTSTMVKGQTFYYDKIVTGQMVNGSNQWFHSLLGHYVSCSVAK